MSFWSRKKKRFSLERLKELYGNLTKNPLITERNKGPIIETLRELAEIMIWGDQHDPAFFDYFLEKNILGILLRIMHQKDTMIHVQILQTMSILLENISTQGSIYYLLSNDRVNEIIQFHFDFSDEELMAYYISFLKTLSLKLDDSTVQFFFNHQTQQFPLYTESVKFFNHSEGMVRVGVRTISLAVFKVSEPRVRAFIVSGESTPYFTNLVWFIQSKAEELEKVIARVPSSPRSQHKFRDCIDELTDLLYYIQDIYALNINELNSAMTHNLMTKLSDFVNALSSMSKTAPRVALYVLGQIFYIIKDEKLVKELGELILDNPHNRIMILKLLQTDHTCLPSLFLLLCLSRNHTTAPVLLAKSLARQSSLLDVILGEKKEEKEAEKEVWNEDEKALVIALAGLLQNEKLSITTLQCAVLLLRSLQGGSRITNAALLETIATAYETAKQPLKDMLESAPSSLISEFEENMNKYKQLQWTRVASNAVALLLPKAADPGPTDAVHRFLVVRDIWVGQRDDLLPLKPVSVPLTGVGQTLTVTLNESSEKQVWKEQTLLKRRILVYSTHLDVLEGGIEEDFDDMGGEGGDLAIPSFTAKVVASMPIQYIVASFVRDGMFVSQSLSSNVLRICYGDKNVDLTFSTPEVAAELQTALLERKNDILDSKLHQLSVLLGVKEEKKEEDEKEGKEKEEEKEEEKEKPVEEEKKKKKKGKKKGKKNGPDKQ